MPDPTDPDKELKFKGTDTSAPFLTGDRRKVIIETWLIANCGQIALFTNWCKTANSVLRSER
ncbi:MAG: hypothetical protein GDA48_18435 [Hormoscilla sp. GM102CHS1]|nr:hypothetical protein [Hormoscilla sp. GM102CHS1]